jgi:hypothetical protein
MGILDKLKSAFGIQGEQQSNEFIIVFENCVEEATKESSYFYTVNFSNIESYNQIIKKWDDEKKGLFIVFLTESLNSNFKGYQKGSKKETKDFQLANQMIPALFRSKMKFTEGTIVSLYSSFKNSFPEKGYDKIHWWPLAGFFKQIEFNYPDVDIPNTIKTILEDILSFEKETNSYYYKDQLKLEEKIKSFLFKSENDENSVKPTYFVGEDNFKNIGNAILDQIKKEDQQNWFTLMQLAQKATGAKPTQKFLAEAKITMDKIGSDKFKKVTQEWFQEIINLKETITTHTQIYYKQEYQYNSIEFLSSPNVDILKGFVWMSSWYYDSNTIITISKLSERCFKKIPEKGPASAGLGNACLYTLFASKGLDGIAQLSRLRLKIKQNNTLALIEKYIAEAATKLGVSSSEIEDLAVDDFKLENHEFTYQFDEIKGTLSLIGMGKSIIKWYKADGTEQKSVPQLVKDKFDAKLKKLKSIQKQIDQTTSAQKERIDRMLRCDRVMTLDYFKEKYQQHGLLSFVIQKIIFNFSNNSKNVLAIYLKDQFYTIDFEVLELEKFTHVSFWHPATSSTQEVKNWRSFLMEGQIQQPFKQAYREIYLLTDAEVNTRTYSNRMASHILKQHQYVTLAKGRNWKAKLIGAWDGGDDDVAKLYLPEYKLCAEFWVNSLNADDQFNATGIWNYVTTDQIRFINTETNELVDLVDIPAIAFSEVMRDVDLFVGVSSVGNDPTWSDSGGLPTYRDYWQSYSFGDLSEIAKNRKEILLGLIPRLKIASVTHIEDRFVVVKGKIRTYKIHIGSTNILMEPNDQYLCIVPDRSLKETNNNLFLPFEGDNGLSVIISKALLLANDDKITDTTITSQINR